MTEVISSLTQTFSFCWEITSLFIQYNHLVQHLYHQYYNGVDARQQNTTKATKY